MSDPDGLRYYQRDAADAVTASLGFYDSSLVVMATGLGKTRVVSAIIKHWPGRVLFLAHRDELLEQGRAELARQTGEWVDLEKAEFHAYKARIVVASIQTLSKQVKDWTGALEMRRLKKLLAAGPFTLVVVDEAHRAVAPTYRRVLDALGCKTLGVTATSDRLDKQSVGKVFEDCAYRMDILSGIESGYLVPTHARHVELESIDLRDVRSSRAEGGLNLHELDEAMVRAVEHITSETRNLEPDRQGIAFFPGVRSAEYAAERFNAIRPGSAICITGDTDPDDRRAMVAEFKRGGYQYLANCQVATEGFDAPGASLIIQGRPTKSRMLYTQMVGRATRVLPNVVDGLPGDGLAGQRRDAIEWSDKPSAMVLDFAGNCGRHSLVGPEDVFVGDHSDTEVARAKAIAKNHDSEALDPQETLKLAREELRAMAAAIQSKVRSKVRGVDPFQVFGLDTGHGNYGKSRPSERMLGALQRAGIPGAQLKAIDKGGAKRLMDAIGQRRSKNLCTFKQLAKLQQFGVKEAGFSQAGRALDYLQETGWGSSTDHDELAKIVEG